MRKALMLLLVAMWSVTVSAQNTNPPVICDHKPLALDWPENAPIQLIGKQLLFTSQTDSSWAYLELRNKGSAPLSQVVALIEISDQEGRHLLTFAAHAVAQDFIGHVPPVPDFVEPDNGGRLETVLFPGGTTPLIPTNPRSLMTCPAHAQLLMLQVDDIHDKQFRYSAAHWRTDPLLKSSGNTALSAAPFRTPYEKLVTIKVSEKGKPSLTYIADYPKKLPEWLETLLASWTFAPTEFDGKPLQDEIEILFRFHSQPKPEWDGVLKYRDKKLPFVVVDIYQPAKLHSPPFVTFGPTIANAN